MRDRIKGTRQTNHGSLDDQSDTRCPRLSERHRCRGVGSTGRDAAAVVNRVNPRVAWRLFFKHDMRRRRSHERRARGGHAHYGHKNDHPSWQTGGGRKEKRNKGARSVRRPTTLAPHVGPALFFSRPILGPQAVRGPGARLFQCNGKSTAGAGARWNRKAKRPSGR